MSERDELAQAIDGVLYTDSFYGDMFRNGQGRETLIKTILAAGYRKPRVITTVDELDTLPFESVIRDGDECVLERWGEMYENGWVTPMVTSFVPHDQIRLPATVLYDPSAS